MKINFLQIIIKLFIDDISIFYIIKCIILIEKNNTNKIKLKLTPRIYILPPKKTFFKLKEKFTQRKKATLYRQNTVR